MEAHVEDPQHAHYTIVVPKYAAEEKRTQAAEQEVDGEQSRMSMPCSSRTSQSVVCQSCPTAVFAGDMRVTSKRAPTSKRPCVYVSYLPDDPVSTKIATYIKRMLLDEYGVSGVVLEPDDGRLNYIDFDMKMKVVLFTDAF